MEHNNSMNIIIDNKYTDMSSKDKKYIEKRMVSLILGKSTRCDIFLNDRGYLHNTRKTSLNIDHFWEPEFICNYREVCMKKLPKKVANLLAITHRPLFEIYKKYLEESK